MLFYHHILYGPNRKPRQIWKEWQCDTTFKGGVTLSLFSTLWVADRGANSRLKGKLAGKVRLTLTFSLAILFSTLPAIHSSSDAALISYGEVVRLSSNHHVWMSTEWQWESLHFLQSALLVWQVSTQSQRALALCPWMWASKWVTVWHQGKIDILGLIHTVRSRLRSSSRSAQSRPRIHTCHSPF